MARPKQRPASVGTAVFRPGSRTTGEITLADLSFGSVTAPVMIVTGAKPGPTLWAQAAIHGAEIGGTIALRRLLEQLDPTTMAGAIVAVLVANPLAFAAQTKNTPHDGVNMNRAFPSSGGGTITSQMAHRLEASAVETADVFVDLHSGGLNGSVPFYSLYWDDGSATSKEAAHYAQYTMAPNVCSCQDEWLLGAAVIELTRQDIPSVMVECGTAREVTEVDIEKFMSAVSGVAGAMKIISAPSRQMPNVRQIGKCDLVFCSHGGFFIPGCEAGDLLKVGDMIGRVIDVYGKEREILKAPKRAFVSAISRPYLPVHSGTMIGEINDLIE